MKECKTAIGWTIADIKGINPTFCMRKIILEEGYKPSREHQRRLNSNMKEIVKKEAIKWLDAGIIFSISDNSWELKKRPVTAPIIVASDWEQPFELICDASDYAMVAVLGQRNDKVMHPIYYASRTLSGAQLNYIVTDKVVPNRSKVIVYTDHAALRKGMENQVTCHLSRLEGAEKKVEIEEISETFVDEQPLVASLEGPPWYADIANNLASDIVPYDLSYVQKKKFLRDGRIYFWDEPYLFKLCVDNIIQICIPEIDQSSILQACHTSPYGGHFEGVRTVAKLLESGFYWPTQFKDTHFLVKGCVE
ncbi:uncharacterized protein [Nicotiana tomentosiformis]|uniref:uncharacterized protein n=1 Tax=Nicotiana tomentosiformis TaxID=4098 RepID=UPI00388C637D